MSQKLEANIWKYTLLLIANKRVFAAIWGAYYLTIPNVTAQSIGTLLMASSVAGFLLEIPSGYLSDKIGHKHALVIARVMMFFATLSFVLANNFIWLLVAQLFFSASEAFHSGTGSAFMHETLRALKRDGDYTKIMGKISAVGFSIPTIFTALVPFLVSISFKAPFVFSLVIDLIGLLAAMSLTSPPGNQTEIEEVKTTNFRQVLQEGHRLNYFPIAILSATIGATLYVIGNFRAPYQAAIGIPVIWFGILFSTGRILASLTLAYSGRLKKYFKLASFFQFQIFIHGVFILLLGLVPQWWLVASIFIVMNAFKWGLSRMEEGYQLELIRSSRFKATLLSVSAQIESGICAILGLGLGILIEKTSYQTSFLYLAIAFFIILIPFGIYIRHKYAKHVQTADA